MQQTDIICIIAAIVSSIPLWMKLHSIHLAYKYRYSIMTLQEVYHKQKLARILIEYGACNSDVYYVSFELDDNNVVTGIKNYPKYFDSNDKNELICDIQKNVDAESGNN